MVADDIEGVQSGAPVWICGMARSGSTVLLEMLNELPEFTSHRYSDYPWLWTPYWWNRLHARLPLRPTPKHERAHQDGMAVNRDSPEAFEEIFWMRFFEKRHDPKASQVLEADTEVAAFSRFFEQHQRKLLAVRGASRYLAKANYQVARLGLLRHLYADARFVIPVREPLAQVASLIRQDALFSRLDREDPAVSAHLARIGHFEFGPHKRAFNLGSNEETAAITACFERGDLAEGYARQWVAQYGFAMRRLSADAELASACLWLSHDRICADPRNELLRLGNHLGLAEDVRQSLVDNWAHRLRPSKAGTSTLSAAESDRVRALAEPLWHELQAWITRPAVPP